MRISTWQRSSYVWVTLGLFVVAFAGHWLLAWYDFKAEELAHGQAPQVAEYLIRTGEQTLENWQSEFLQLVWQVAGLSFLYYVGSPQSKEGDDRREEKLDWLIREVGGEKGVAMIERLDRDLPRT